MTYSLSRPKGVIRAKRKVPPSGDQRDNDPCPEYGQLLRRWCRLDLGLALHKLLEGANGSA